MGLRQDPEDDLPEHLAHMVAQGKHLEDLIADVETNAQLKASELSLPPSFAEIASGSNITAGLGGRYTPPCPWKEYLNNDGDIVGSGSYGEVYVATVKCQKYPVAIKKMKGASKSEVEHEANIMDKFSSNNFVKIYGMGTSTQERGIYYILMESAGGGTLDTYIKQLRKGTEASFQLAVNLFIDSLYGLLEMHEHGYHHRDVKPQNILVTEDCSKGSCQAKLADLGGSCHQSVCQDVMGTPYYTAPEIVDNEYNSRRNDVWSFGIILFQILNKGSLPISFRATESIESLYRKISAFRVEMTEEYSKMSDHGIKGGLKQLLVKMLNRDIRTRIAADEVLDETLRVVKGCGILTEPLCPKDETKVEKLLPSCWKGSSKGYWHPTHAIKRPDEPTPPPKTRQVVQVVKRPKMAKGQVPQVLANKRIEDQGVVRHERRFTPGKMGAILVSQTGLIEQIDAGGFQGLQVEEGWFIEKVCGKAYSWERLGAAIQGKCQENPFTIIFREEVKASAAQVLPDDNEGMRMKTHTGQDADVKVFVIPVPKTHAGVGFIFSNYDLVSRDGVVQPAWERKSIKKWTKDIPLKPGDEILRVNNEKWDDIVNDPQSDILRRDLAQGRDGKLTFLYLAA